MTDDLHETLISTAASLAAAISLLERGGKAVKKAAPSDKMFDIMLEDYRNSLKEARAALAAAPQPAPDDPYAELSQHLHGDGDGPARYGKRRVDRMFRDMNALRQVIRAEGTPAIQNAWDRVEECIDFAYGGCPQCRATHTKGDDA